MLTLKDKTELLNKVLSSKTFAKTTTARVLLKFVVESSIESNEVSALRIGQELFGSNYDLEKSEINARVNIYHLRKKLDAYYSEEGAADKIRISIAKGTYLVTFEKNPASQSAAIVFLRSTLFKVGLSLFVGTLITLVVINQSRNSKIPFWNSFLTDSENTAVLIGDLYSFMGPAINGKRHLIRNLQVNNDTEFSEFINRTPGAKGKYQRTAFRILNQSAPYATYMLGVFFERNQHHLELFINSNIGVNVIKSKPTIFLGNPKTLYDLQPILEASNTSNIKLVDRQIFSIDPNTGNKKFYKNQSLEDDEYETDYTFVSYFKKPGGKDAFVFVSDHDFGIISAIDFFTNTDSIQHFRNKLPENAEYFSAIFKASGLNRNDLGFELIMAEPILK